MTRAKNPPADEPIAERIEDVDVATEMQGSFLEYAYSVIYSRALPDARDGMKPVHRRILFQMSEMGLRPDRPYVKSARVVGDVMGKLHPHGDSAIYDAMVRLAQPFTQRLPLVDGHGNFGSLDDGPAAARYTEARLTAAALAMTDGLDEDVVEFVPNYDNQLTQPEVLPAAYPNLLVNGASGIAVGMATNMAPHNLIEVVGAAIHLLDNPEATVEELMEFVPGPDLPSGGIIVGLDGIKDAYTNGRGSFRTRAKVSIESLGPRRTGLVVTELPYLVGPERVIEKIKDALNAKKLQGIADVNDLTDRHHGLRLVIGIKTGFDPQAVLEHLYRLTPLEDSFSINNVALVGGQPQTLGLRELLLNGTFEPREREGRRRSVPVGIDVHQRLPAVEQAGEAERGKHAADVFGGQIEIDVGTMPLAVAVPLAAHVHLHVVRTRLELVDTHALGGRQRFEPRLAEIRRTEAEVADPQMQRRMVEIAERKVARDAEAVGLVHPGRQEGGDCQSTERRDGDDCQGPAAHGVL